MIDDGQTGLRDRAQGGDPRAMTAYAKSLLEAPDPQQQEAGAALVARAARAGDAEALAQNAALVACGVFNTADIGAALALLVHSAERGWAPAQDDLRFLAGASGDDFAAFRRQIDIAAWVAPPNATTISQSPRIITARGLLRETECARLIAKTRNRLKRASVYDAATGSEAHSDERSNSSAMISLADYDVPYALMRARFSALLGLPATFFEAAQVLHYDVGQEFTAHFDFLHAHQPGLAADMQARGQRSVTLLASLNEGYEGGETEFPRLNYAYKGRTGDGLAFANVNAQGAPEPLTLHAGTPLHSGEKWILSQWVRDRPQMPAAG